ncbi:MAG TPA: peroxiredoxin, partial [Spongiibacteraceae bacterium]|nr:peroxiredoxin [Spongiibacteraceae bacterium]
LGLPYQLLNDSELLLAEKMRLPTFEYADLKLIKRITLIARDGVIEKVFYPVFPPNSDAENVINWLKGSSA